MTSPSWQHPIPWRWSRGLWGTVSGQDFSFPPISVEQEAEERDSHIRPDRLAIKKTLSSVSLYLCRLGCWQLPPWPGLFMLMLVVEVRFPRAWTASTLLTVPVAPQVRALVFSEVRHGIREGWNCQIFNRSAARQ